MSLPGLNSNCFSPNTRLSRGLQQVHGDFRRLCRGVTTLSPLRICCFPVPCAQPHFEKLKQGVSKGIRSCLHRVISENEHHIPFQDPGILLRKKKTDIFKQCWLLIPNGDKDNVQLSTVHGGHVCLPVRARHPLPGPRGETMTSFITEFVSFKHECM